MLLSAVSVLVVAQWSSEISEGLKNSPVFDVHVTVHRVKFLTIKRTRYTNVSYLFLE